MPTLPTFASKLQGTAREQWEFFGKQQYDETGHVVQAGHKEGEAGFFQQVGDYWLVGVNLKGIDGRNHDMPWSAAFISWSERQAGAGDRFHYSAQHSLYISQAIRDFLRKNEDAGYWGCRLNEQKPQVGDLVCWSRQDGVDYDHQLGGVYAGHCDIVVEVTATEINVIGGNVGDSVTQRPLKLNAQGFIVPVTQNGETLFALMQSRLDLPPVPATS
jgi:hypothetical protein